ncbi:MAG: lactate/malate dehydrogenase family protein [Fuerstiella sp.]
MKVTVVGTGNVGSALAYAIVLEGLADELVLLNRTAQVAEGHALDLQHAASLVKHTVDVRGGSFEQSRDSDVVVMTLSIPLDIEKPDRREMAEGNAKILADWMPKLAAASPNAIYLMVTNPVDAMTWAALHLTDLSSDKVCGIGTIVDSARFRTMMSKQLGIHADDIRAYILGEHGQSQVAAINMASIGGELIDESLEKAHQLAQNTVKSGFEILRLKGCTNFAVAKATAMVIEAIRYNLHSAVPLSVMLDGYCGIDDVCLSIPVVMGRSGVTRRMHPRLADSEFEAFRRSAEEVRKVCDQIRPFLEPS